MKPRTRITLASLARRRSLRVVGLMSGTSADGVDAAVVDIDSRGATLRAFATFPYRPALRRRIFDLFSVETARIDEICDLNFVLGEVFAQAVIDLAASASIAMDSIDLIGSHGQTIHHLPYGLGGRTRRGGPSTLQIGEPCVIAERTGLTTVADFRTRDAAAGGQGAPLVPLTDWVLLRHGRKSRAIQNIGGIANVTYLPAGGSAADILAFDTGPGNMIIDRMVSLATQGRRSYDAGGQMASLGRCDEKLLARLMAHRYLRRRPPKTTGREQFGLEFADHVFAQGRKAGLPARDLVATATAFTARSIARAYRDFLPGKVDEAIICGGGARNDTLVAMLAAALAPAKVLLMDDVGINADAKEAVSFAILAYRTIRGLPGNAPSATGATRPVVLGKIVPGTR